MNNVNKTMYIPLYGKAYVSKKGIFIKDEKAEAIWSKEGFELKGKSASKWLAYYMGIRSAVFDNWLNKQLYTMQDAVIIHIGCGMDARVERIGNISNTWYDIDFTDVIRERNKYFNNTYRYKMISGDIRDNEWLTHINECDHAIVVIEGVSMYMTNGELKDLLTRLDQRFKKIALLMDCYSIFAAKMSKRRNPVKDVGVTEVYGLDYPPSIQSKQLIYLKEHDMTPQNYIDELNGFEKTLFKKLYAGNFSKKLYKLYEFRKQ